MTRCLLFLVLATPLCFLPAYGQAQNNTTRCLLFLFLATQQHAQQTENAPNEQRPAAEAEPAPAPLWRKPSQSRLGAGAPYAPRLGDPSSMTIGEAIGGALSMGSEPNGFAVPPKDSLLLEELKADEPFVFDAEDGTVRAEGNVLYKFGGVELWADFIEIDFQRESILAEGNVRGTQNESSFTADTAFLKRPPKEGPLAVPPLVPHGQKGPSSRRDASLSEIMLENFVIIEPNRTLRGEYFQYGENGQSGEIRNASGRIGPLYFSTKKLHLHDLYTGTAEDIWVTTCDREHPHYRIRLRNADLQDGRIASGTNARFQLGKVNTPLFIPRITTGGYKNDRVNSIDFDSGHKADIGYFVNVAPWFALSPTVNFAPRFYPTTDEGVGFGFDTEYDFRHTPATPLFGGQGSIRTLYTTEKRGYTEVYHRQQMSERNVLLLQWEQWYDKDFVKDFFNHIFDDRTGPRTFLNMTHTRPGQIISFTSAFATHDFIAETEKLPELAYHLLERPVLPNLYLTFDSINGYYERVPTGEVSQRHANIARLTYDLKIGEGLNIAPFVEADGTYYSKVNSMEKSDFRLGATAGVTAQTRLKRDFPGRGNFTKFKHIVVPSVTFSQHSNTSFDFEDAPRFDALDDRPGRARIESKIDNILLTKHKNVDDIWEIARLTLYQGNDIENEFTKADDYQAEFEFRPRPWWGFQSIAQRHDIDPHPALFDTDFERVLAYLFYDDSTSVGNFNGRLGFVYSKTREQVFNREVLYGAGYRINGDWAVSFEQRYDLERDRISRQTYEIRRRLHRWEAAFKFRERESGFDVGIEFSLIDFPGARVKF